MEIGKKYLIIYDDKGNRPVKKRGTLEWQKGNLFKLKENLEELNENNIIRAIPVDSVDGGFNGEKRAYN